ncbi:ABC transporter ATP-binding protein [Thermosyntropha sp.]|uniref:ABC transporter ATP-binding protein n=1 Tax=Thermosyntropha sp. TaxID=2740820 RepID=UPI0025DB5715|nr:ABC transporter ATP-binding protein [Thermosyntropha sp.]MBO8158737.1 ABC transporter ATP-binding protein [Thermosyntropha sp.]
MLTAKDVSKFFGDICAVNKVNISLNKGEIFGLIGPDGAGKTTLMRILCGIIKADEGEINLLDYPISQIERLRHEVGYMPQRFSLYGDLTVMENINFFGSLYGLDYRTINKRVDEILEVTGILPFKKRLAGKLSGGMKQKLALTCALITRPKILILDEPTYGVDPQSRREFWRILYNLCGEGMTIMISTPYMEEAELCTRVGFMSSGSIKLVDYPYRLKENFPYQVIEIIIREKKLINNLRQLSSIYDLSIRGGKYRLIVSDYEKAEAELKEWLSKIGMADYFFKKVKPTMEDIFVMLIEREARNGLGY